MSELEERYEYTVEFDDGSEFVHLYFATVIDFENPAYVRFDPTYEIGEGVEREVANESVIIPYSRVMKIVKRKEAD